MFAPTVHPPEPIDLLIGRIRRALNVGAELEEIHDAMVDGMMVTEERFFLAWKAACILTS